MLARCFAPQHLAPPHRHITINVINTTTTTTTTTTNATTTNNSRRLSRHNDVDSTFDQLKDEADETDASSHAPNL